MRTTYSTALVLEALSRGYHYGFDIMDATNLPSGTVYPILRRLERETMVTSEWEAEGVAQTEQRPPRRYYDLTAEGRKALADTTARYRAPRGARTLRPARQSRG
jgi:PadR family transcriptional regulator, regulatory protein PadR